MLPTFNLLDDEEERRREQEASLGGLLPQDSSAPSTGALTDAGDQSQLLGSLIQKMTAYKADPRMGQLNDKAYQAENASWDRVNNGQQYGIGEILRDVLPGALGVLLDTTTNKGHGLGQIAAATGDLAAQNSQRDRDRFEKDRSFGLNAKGQRQSSQGAEYDQLYKQVQALEQSRRIQQADVQMGLRGRAQVTSEAAEARKGDEHSYKFDPNDPRTKALLDAYEQRAGVKLPVGTTVEMLRDQKKINDEQIAHYFAPQNAADAAAQAGLTSTASTGARINTESQLADKSGETAATIARAGIAPEIEKAQAMNPVLAERTNNGVGAGLSADLVQRDNPYIDFGDAAQLQRALRTRSIGPKTLDDIKAANRGAEIIERLHETAEQFQNLSLADQATSAEGARLRRQYAAHADEYAGVLGKLTGTASESGHQHALDLVPSIVNPYALKGIEGLWSSIEANANGNLGAIGGKARKPMFMRTGSEEPNAAPPEAQAAPTAPAAPRPVSRPRAAPPAATSDFESKWGAYRQ